MTKRVWSTAALSHRYSCFQVRVTFTAFPDASLFEEDDEELTAITNETDLVGLKVEQVINSGVVGSTVAGKVVMNLASPVNIT